VTKPRRIGASDDEQARRCPLRIAIDGEARTYRDRENVAQEATTRLKQINPNFEITLRDLHAGTQTVIKHPSSR
jgi:hypothetical protein